MMMTEASWLKARAISTMCFWATESCLSGASASKSASIRSRRVEQRRRISPQSIRRRPGHMAHEDVFGHAQFVEHDRFLVNGGNAGAQDLRGE